ncbi:arginine deiminase family protein [Alphaproteobacteria bacterium]|nr:arginine deiminase family protein [Alphaproteobacteria bacterium]
MSYKFKNALVRKPSKSIINAISSNDISPDYKKIFAEHKQYIKSLIQSKLNVKILNELERYPDSIFVEDPALAYKNTCILLRPATKSRFGESLKLLRDIRKYFKEILFTENGKIEGGDILRINDHFIIGLSNRTNKIGAENLSYILKSLGASVDICHTPKNILHFKSECSLIDDDTILLTKKMANLNIFNKKYHLIQVPEGEEIVANSIRVNDNLLIPKGFKKTEEILSKNYKLTLLNVNEISKVDAGLSCMSIRW